MNISMTLEQMKGYVSDSLLLLRKEVELAKKETGEKIEQAQSGLILVLVGLLFLFVALMVFAVAAAEMLAAIIPAAFATLIVGGVLALIGIIIAMVGKSKLKPSNLKPERTIDAVEGHVNRMRSTANTAAEAADSARYPNGRVQPNTTYTGEAA